MVKSPPVGAAGAAIGQCAATRDAHGRIRLQEVKADVEERLIEALPPIGSGRSGEIKLAGKGDTMPAPTIHHRASFFDEVVVACTCVVERVALVDPRPFPHTKVKVVAVEGADHARRITKLAGIKFEVDVGGSRPVIIAAEPARI